VKRGEKTEAGKDLPTLKEVVKGLQTKLDVVKKNQDEMAESKESITKQLDKINLDRNKLKVDMTELKALKEKQRDDFYRRLIDFELQ
jgi:hypothetical protein